MQTSNVRHCCGPLAKFTMQLNFFQVINAANFLDDPHFVKWCSDNEVIHDINNPPLCRNCNATMHLEYSSNNTDGAAWRCSACKRRLSIRYDTWTSRSNLSLRLLVKILAYWCDNRSVSNTIADLQISNVTVISKFSEFRKVAQKLYKKDIALNPFGGQLPVQVDESHFFKAKSNVGRTIALPAIWVFGILDMKSNRILMEIVRKRDADTLIPIIQTAVIQGTTVWSDGWGAYTNLPSYGYPHQTVNHSIQFVAANGINTQRIESTWSSVKRWLSKISITSREHLEEYLHEYCFRRNIAPDFATCWHLLNS